MDVYRVNEGERASESMRQQAERAEARLRAIDRQKLNSADKASDSHFVDEAGRNITIRAWDSGKNLYVRAYDTDKTQPPDRVDYGQAGRANATLETLPGGTTRVCLHDVGTFAKYQQAGIERQMIEKIEDFAWKHDAADIHSSLESQEKRDFWSGQADKGWTIDSTKGYYGEAHKQLT